MIRTKIICTIGPSCNTIEKMVQLMEAGMNVARLNFSHGTHEEHLLAIENLKEARRRLNQPLAIMMDTKGPEIRIGKIAGKEVHLHAGQHWHLVKAVVEGDEHQVSVHPGFVLDRIKVGATVLFSDGYISSHVVSTSKDGVVVELATGGSIRSNQGVNIPDAALDLPVVTAQDIADIKFGCQHGVDIIAASFIRSAEHVLQLKNLLIGEKKQDILIIAKIENNEGVQNFDSIVQIADGVMIARGDLGVEVPLSQIPRLQKMMIRKSYLVGKPVITATQMLESMIHNPRPTRAETTDVANAIYDGTSAVMLSGETAVGHYPVEVVQMMSTIAKEAESDFNYQAFLQLHANLVYNDVPSSITMAAVKTAYTSGAQAIFAFTSGGKTARLLSRLRPNMPLIAMTPHETTYHQLALEWGVIPFLTDASRNIEEAFVKICDFALKERYVSYGDLVVVTAGTPFGFAGTTNMMFVENIGDVLVRGNKGLGKRVHGNVMMILSMDEKMAYAVSEHLIVITKCDPSYLPLLRNAAGVILQNHIDDRESEKHLLAMGKLMNKPVLVRADNACRILKEGQLVTLDPERALVFKGVII